MEILNELIADHRRLHSLLILFERELVAYDADEKADLQLMEDVVRYYAEYFDRFHHPLEDCLFVRMLSRELQQDTGSHDAISQHDQLRRITDRLLAALDQLLHDTIIMRAELTDAGRQFLRQNRDHIRHEELYPFVHARQYLTADDWHAIDTAADSVRARIDLEYIRRQYDGLLASLHNIQAITTVADNAYNTP